MSASLLTPADTAAFGERFGDRVTFDAPLAAQTWWRVGGAADAFIEARSVDDVTFVVRESARRKLPVFVLGAGSNVLVGDGGVRGVVLHLGGALATFDVRIEGESVVVRAGAAASLPHVVARAATLGAVGIDALAGVPATIGGAVCLNAGTDREIGEFVRTVRVQSPATLGPRPIWVGFSYRHSTVPRDAVVTDAELAFACGDSAAVRERTQARLVRRKATQPVALPNAGSCFRNPPGDHAARLIEAVGAKGWRVGGAEVSSLHANFIVNVERARAIDVASLLARVRRAVFERFAIELRLEVHLVGEFV